MPAPLYCRRSGHPRDAPRLPALRTLQWRRLDRRPFGIRAAEARQRARPSGRDACRIIRIRRRAARRSFSLTVEHLDNQKWRSAIARVQAIADFPSVEALRVGRGTLLTDPGCHPTLRA